MKYLSRNDLETIGGRVIEAYKRLPAISGQALERVDIDFLCQELLGLRIDYARLSLNGEKIGLTSSCDIGVEVFPEDPSSTEEQYYMLDGKTILIESDLMKEGANIGRRNYTVSHESCHHILKMLFPHDYGAQASGRSIHCCYRSNRGNGDWEEWQVETLAAMILLPPECVVRSMERFGLGTQMRLLNRVFAPADYKKFEAIASFMGASKTALSIRMTQLGLLKRNDLFDPYSLVRVDMDEEDRNILGQVISRLEMTLAAMKRNNLVARDLSNSIAELNAKLLMLEQLRSKGYLAPEVYQAQANEIGAELAKLKDVRQEKFNSKAASMLEEVKKLKMLIFELEEPLEAFDEKLFLEIVKSIQINKEDEMSVEFLGGLRFKERI